MGKAAEGKRKVTLGTASEPRQDASIVTLCGASCSPMTLGTWVNALTLNMS